MIRIKSVETVGVNKLGILFLGTIACLVGIMPAAFTIGRLDSLIFFVGTTLIGAYSAVKSFESSATEKPSLSEYIIGSMNITAWGVFTSIVFFTFFSIAFGIVYGIELLGNFLFEMQIDEFFISYIISLIITLLIAWVFSEAAIKDYAEQLYPNKARIKSSFYDLANLGKIRLFKYFGSAFTVLVLIILIVWYTTGSLAVWNVWWFNIILLVYLLIVSASTMVKSKGFDPELPNAIAAVEKLLKVMGYTVVPNPITGKATFDPFLSGLDFYAQKNGQSIAVAVRAPESEKSGQWKPSHLLRSAWALETFSQEEQKTKLIVTPVVVFTGEMNEKIDDNIIVIKLPKKDISEILTIEKKKKLKDIANYYLQFSDAHEDPSVSQYENNTSGAEK